MSSIRKKFENMGCTIDDLNSYPGARLIDAPSGMLFRCNGLHTIYDPTLVEAWRDYREVPGFYPCDEPQCGRCH